MFKLFIVLLGLSISNGYTYNGLRVKIGWSDALADQEYFFKIPRTSTEAESLGWTRTERPPGPIPELRMYCPKGRAVCPLYDTAGFIAGLQLALPADEFGSQPFKPEKNFVKWVVPATATEPAATYWAISQYYVSEETLKAGAGPTLVNGATLQDGGVWVKGPDGDLIRIPTTVAELNTTKFVKQNCVPNMGTHYYYGLSKNMKCDDFFPWFPLTSEDKVIGVGFMMIGTLTRSKPVEREWFELNVFKQGSLSLIAPDAPDCLSNLLETYNGVFLHIYYIDEPWTLTCRSGDSVKPAPLLDRVLLTAYRYANSVADNVKNLFTK